MRSMSGEMWGAIVGVVGTMLITAVVNLIGLWAASRADRRRFEHEDRVRADETARVEDRRAWEVADAREERRVAALVDVDISLESYMEYLGRSDTEKKDMSRKLIHAIAKLRSLDPSMAVAAGEARKAVGAFVYSKPTPGGEDVLLLSAQRAAMSLEKYRVEAWGESASEAQWMPYEDAAAHGAEVPQQQL